MCCRMYRFRVAPKSQGLQRRADQLLLRAYTCVCVAEYINQGLHQRTKDYKGLTDQLLLRAHTHTPRELQNTPIQDCTRGSRVTKVWPTTCCCEHTHACCRVSQFKVATRSFTGLATNCFCEHTDVCCRKYQFRPAPRT